MNNVIEIPLPNDVRNHVLAHYSAVTDGWCWPEKAEKLAEFIWSRRPFLTVEIGVFGGKSFIPMAAVVAHLESAENEALPVYEIHGIDPWAAAPAVKYNEGTEHEKFWGNQAMLDAVYARAAQRCEALCSRSIKLFRETSEQAAKRYGHGCQYHDPIGFIHLDSNHSEEQSMADVQLWWGKLQMCGVFAFDDTSWTSQQKALAWLKERGVVLWEYDKDGHSCMIFEKRRE